MPRSADWNRSDSKGSARNPSTSNQSTPDPSNSSQSDSNRSVSKPSASPPVPLPSRRRWELSRRWRRALLVGFGIAVVGGLVGSFRPAPAEVDLVVAGPGVVEEVVVAEARTRLRTRAEIRAPANGVLERPVLRAGDAVEEGSVVARLHPPGSPLLDPRTRARREAELEGARARAQVARAALEGAEAEVVGAEIELRRQERLRRDDGGFDVAVEVARAFLEARQAMVAAARAELQRQEARVAEVEAGLSAWHPSSIEAAPGLAPAGARAGFPTPETRSSLRALEPALDLTTPLTGLVLRVHRESGGPVFPGELLMEVGEWGEVGEVESDPPMEVVAAVPTAQSPRIRPGTPVRLTGWGESLGEGRVRLLEPSGFTRVSPLGMDEQRVNVIVDLPTAPSASAQPSRLGHDYRGRVAFVIQKEEVPVRLPTGAVLPRGGEWRAFRANGNRLEEVAVTVGLRGPDWVEVTEGIQVGDRVVRFPGERVADGVRFLDRGREGRGASGEGQAGGMPGSGTQERP